MSLALADLRNRSLRNGDRRRAASHRCYRFGRLGSGSQFDDSANSTLADPRESFTRASNVLVVTVETVVCWGIPI